MIPGQADPRVEPEDDATGASRPRGNVNAAPDAINPRSSKFHNHPMRATVIL